MFEKKTKEHLIVSKILLMNEKEMELYININNNNKKKKSPNH